MMSHDSMRRLAMRSARVLPALAIVGLCGLAFAAAVSPRSGLPVTGKSIPPPQDKAEEAPAAFDDQTNGHVLQPEFGAARDTFMEIDDRDKGLGPVYNARSCVDCHQNPITGGSSQIVEIRSGKRTFDPADPNPHKVRFEEPPGGSVIQQRAVDPAIQELVPPEDDVRTFRLSNSILGNGYVEVIPDEEFLRIRKEQRKWGMEGFAVVVPVPVEAKKGTDGKTVFTSYERIGRFGWKCQEASLLNFSSGAYITEIGITNPMQPTELTSNGRDVSKYDLSKKPDPEDPDEEDGVVHLYGVDVEAFTTFMRSTKASPRDPMLVGTPDVVAGEALFRDNKVLGCAVCHQPDYTTPKADSLIKTLDGKRGSDMEKVSIGLGNKTFHPYSDFMLHDVETGDGIAQTQHADMPSRAQRNLNKIPEGLRTDNGIGRVEGDYEKANKHRTLQPADPGVDQRTANKVRTAPLWGLRTRPQLMHDGLTLTVEDAILRHKGQAEGVRLKYEALSSEQKKQLLAFLSSL
jgi:CxxC motif-containing protein (DUF1111 family)